MSDDNNSVVAVFSGHDQAEAAIKELQISGFDMTKLSIIGKGYHVEEQVVGYYNLGDRVLNWGRTGAFWGWIWGLVFGSALFFIPTIGPVMIGGPIVSWFVGALEAAVVVGSLSALGAALVGAGIPEHSVLRYESALKADKFLVIAHGTQSEVERAKSILDTNKAETTDIHGELKQFDTNVVAPNKTAAKV
ncbi:MAG: hypothetical protein P4L53_12520 [Candidatus Obscuribacterales bacterium]|nr:hypothetical protein [Candidatus Obscuribacterales bacterium]